ncbi:MAG: hypothetical protein IJS01_06400 [Lentisphaeria bacterium]|nr:hypothetical protein [Lentisphaeria bacterium]
MKKTALFLTGLAGAAFLLCAGCVVHEETVAGKRALGERAKDKYAPLKGYRLKLEMVGSGRLYAGDGGVVTFSLENCGNKRIDIEEWFSNEPDNIVISCQNYLPGMTQSDPEGWVRLETPPRQPAWRFPLQLAPGNKVQISKALPFVDNLVITPGSERRFFIKAELALKSVTAASRVAVITVRNPADRNRKRPPAEKSRHFGR